MKAKSTQFTTNPHPNWGEIVPLLSKKDRIMSDYGF